MNSEPCVRFGIRISPKIRENPADNRNKSPPSVMLLIARMRVWFIAAGRRLVAVAISRLPPPREAERTGGEGSGVGGVRSELRPPTPLASLATPPTARKRAREEG